MLKPRCIPVLLMSDSGLVKTKRFKEPQYVGDPVNAVKIFNEKKVDELCILDIDAASKNYTPDYKMIQNLANECRMPICYGGGVTTLEQVEKIIGLGVEKVSISSAAVSDPDLITSVSKKIGAQSIAVTIDVKKTGIMRRYEVVTHNGTRRTGVEPAEFAYVMQEMGAGEIVVNSVDRDGMMNGYDLDLIRLIREKITVPMTVIGGAGSLDDVVNLWSEFGLMGAAAGSMFVFKGKYRAVLINYPGFDEKNKAILKAGLGA